MAEVEKQKQNLPTEVSVYLERREDSEEGRMNFKQN